MIVKKLFRTNKFYKKLTEINNDKTSIVKLKLQIEKSQAMSKQWLLEKVDELLN